MHNSSFTVRAFRSVSDECCLTDVCAWRMGTEGNLLFSFPRSVLAVAFGWIHDGGGAACACTDDGTAAVQASDCEQLSSLERWFSEGARPRRLSMWNGGGVFFAVSWSSAILSSPQVRTPLSNTFAHYSCQVLTNSTASWRYRINAYTRWNLHLPCPAIWLVNIGSHQLLRY